MGIKRNASKDEKREYLRDWRKKNPGYYKTPEQRERRAGVLRRWKEKHPGYFNAATKRMRAEKRAFLWRIKSERGCLDCGIKDPIVLDFDHRDPKQKNPTIIQRRSGKSGWAFMSWDAIHAELEKCDVVCANCHRRRTAAMFGWRDYDELVTAAGRKEAA